MPLTASTALGGWTWAPKLLQGSGVCPQRVPEGLNMPSPQSWDHSQAGDVPAELSMQELVPAETGQQLDHTTAHIPSINPRGQEHPVHC